MEVAHVGVKTRARSLAMVEAVASSGTEKRRKIVAGDSKLSSSLVQFGSCHSAVVTPEKNSVSPATTENSASDDRCSSQSSDHVPTSCCSCNASSDFEKETFGIVDLEDDRVQFETSTSDFGCSERREKTPSGELQSESGDLESTARPSEVNSRRKFPVEKMPSETELEEFFAAAEKDLQKRFTEK
ncbi:hypothetical protein Acr_00g0032920 [Actinidia rufa]|uniref:Cyclin-dependent kinase inhibitor n=1 Tax=Actinidia rufa TaxID=165716 RepID=A0A7J0DGQ1_9ERIC|nr:hypothetical protein Acr_00g0032920 [Actinidia rufa]